ncbi:erythromycin esterase family protein [Danxiaibacter flavus]|uniref:Erythromycin esterase family protein n=1 Tax=Danxiaibacter flavus TaxID=3049108 RepID=A0ABV3ZEU2_9BACT|nr:erythromycin esterase family protein [Chitinophagaceae bacterium DXS]
MHSLLDIKSLDAMFKEIEGRHLVMLGEASHGTHEYYTWRTSISEKLIQEQGFNFIAVEGDWPDCYLINRYVKGYKDAGESITDVLNRFDRWPAWMWANWEIAALAEWLRQYNLALPIEKRVGFYGLDVYSLWDSMKAMIEYLQNEDPQAAESVKKALLCFEPFNENEQMYARYSLRDNGCRDEVVTMLREIRKKAQFLDGDREAGFNTEQNAWIAVNAEKYYSSMIGFDHDSWNIRDTHMMDTLTRLMQFHGEGSKGIVWAHNTHVGDARATNMSRAGMVNIGQLAREQYGDDDVFLVGFASYAGSVIAGSQWGAPMQEMDVPEARGDSIEAKLHKEHGSNLYLLFSEEKDDIYIQKINHRAIGVVYNPENERLGNYVPSLLAMRYDTLIYLDETRALHPLCVKLEEETVPETFPFGV